MKNGDKLTPPIGVVLLFWAICAVWLAPCVLVAVLTGQKIVEWVSR